MTTREGRMEKKDGWMEEEEEAAQVDYYEECLYLVSEWLCCIFVVLSTCGRQAQDKPDPPLVVARETQLVPMEIQVEPLKPPEPLET